jgi:type III restriction enzyme
MRFTLKDFQLDAADRLMDEVSEARPGAARGKAKAIVLSSPTGSGKTVIITEMIERILFGYNGVAADPKATFLWLSDLPQLNEQSKGKIAEASDKIDPTRLVTIENWFKDPRLRPGMVYFLNTQKLTSASLLTQQGDDRESTIWQIIERTVAAAPASFYLIIDEAHRGMRDAESAPAVRTRNENKRFTTVQRFIKGDPNVGLPAVPMIVGVSATPERFQKLLDGTDRTVHSVTVNSASVRVSGLIKDRIKLSVADDGDQADWSMLREAGRRFNEYRAEWSDYCAANRIKPIVSPVMVVQVENGNAKKITQTDLGKCVKELTQACGHFPSGALAHCFEEEGDVPAGDYQLRKIEASKIADDPDVRVVFFKTALSTGWDCPRAEVMMSFRKAVDDTLIAQLVGRMVRTPLARRIESNDFLNSVSLALPHYDDSAVGEIVKKLQDPETGAAGEVVREKETAVYRRAAGADDLFAALAKLPTYVLDRPKRMAESSRLVKLARQLTFNGVGDGLQAKARRFVIDALLEQRQRLRKDAKWADRVEGQARVPVTEFTIEYGQWKTDTEPASYLIEASEENIYDLFQRCSGILGEGLHDTYANRPEFRGDIHTARLELFFILQDAPALKLVQEKCETEFERLWQEHKEDILQMSAPTRDKYNQLRRRGATAAAESIIVPDTIEVRKESQPWVHHLYVDERGKFGWKAGTWEAAVMEQESKRREHKGVKSEYAGFLRNVPRKPWALCVPYGSSNGEAMFPDLLIFRRVKGKVVVDMLEPHGDHFADGLAKAQGLARYARDHGDSFGRIEAIRVAGGRIERLNLQDRKIRDKVIALSTAEQFINLYEEYG